jgi:hypothetical protein
MNPAHLTSWVSAALPIALLALPAACGSSASSSSPTDGGADTATVLDSGAGVDSAVDTGTRQDAGSDTGAADAAPDVDNGAPSTHYPAPHPPLPVLTNAMHGPVLSAPKVHLVFYPSYPYETALQAFAQAIGPSTYWPAVTSEYGIGQIAYAGTTDLTGQTPPGNISSTTIHDWVATEIQSGAFGTPDPQAIYTIVYPQSTVVTQPNPVTSLLGPVQSCSAFYAFHDNTTVTPADGGAPQNYAFAVLPTCSTVVDDLTSYLSHEWVEAVTDPFPTSTGLFTLTGGPSSAFFNVDADHVIWALTASGGEAGDQCQPEGNGIYITPTDIGNTVQRTWSNLSAQGSHDPCVPAPTGSAFFDSAPVLTEMVTFVSSAPFPVLNVTTQGITIPVGQSKTIEVDLFSDGDTGGPWTVQADDAFYKQYGSTGLVPNSLSFKWDRTQGVNGEKLHLTITVTSASIVGKGHAFMITSTLGSRQTVWTGMIVE